jgi:hypothetical protein
VLGGQTGFGMIDEGQLFQILYEKAKTNRWYILFFPSEFSHVYHEIEETFYAPKSGRNIGFEIIPIPTQPTAIIMCFKDWMKKEELSKIFEKHLQEHFMLPDGKDISVITYDGEDKNLEYLRMGLLYQLNDYFIKQEENK